jgi:hypothetical protein
MDIHFDNSDSMDNSMVGNLDSFEEDSLVDRVDIFHDSVGSKGDNSYILEEDNRVVPYLGIAFVDRMVDTYRGYRDIHNLDRLALVAFRGFLV